MKLIVCDVFTACTSQLTWKFVMPVKIKITDRLFLCAINILIYTRYAKHIIRFWRKVGYFPNATVPKLYHEKMLWRRIFDRNPIFTTFCDKLATKAFVRSVLPDAVIPETVWIGTDISGIPCDLDKSRFVLKANHGCNFNYFPDREKFDISHISRIAEEWLKTTFGVRDFQWGYTNARKLLFLEEKIEIPEGEEMVDLTVRASNGKAILCQAIINNKMDTKKYGYFDIRGSRIGIYNKNIPQQSILPDDFRLPECFSEAVEYAVRLSKNIDYARYDFMCAGEKLYIGEITVYPSAGLTHYIPHTCDSLINEHWDIRTSYFLSAKQKGWKYVYAGILHKLIESQVT